MSFYPKPTKLIDCYEHGPGSRSELFIVEGDSASKAVAKVRTPRYQAVLPMQGKPLNAIKASKSTVARNELFGKLIDALGAGWDETTDLQQLRYGRVIMLFDPDADGIHCGALLLMFFHRWIPSLIAEGKLSVVHPPLYELAVQDEVVHAYSDQHFRKLREALDSKQIRFTSKRFRGLASMSDRTLSQCCLSPQSRRIHLLTEDDALASLAAFGGRPE